MGAPNVKRILARWPYPEAAVEAYSTAMTAAFGHPGAWELIEKAVDNCAAGEKRTSALCLTRWARSPRSVACLHKR